MDPRALIRLEAELEYGVALHGDVIPVTADNTREVPLITIARVAGGNERLFREGLSSEQRARFSDDDASSLLAAPAETLPYRIIDCCWYAIARIPDPSEFPAVTERDGCFVIERDGQIVTEAWSSRDSLHAAEVEVETHSGYRRRGYGRQVVVAWAHHVRCQGKTAFYSHLKANGASRALAESVGAIWFADTREFFRE